MASKQFGFWDMSKSRHKSSQETLKEIQMSQSPINIKDSDSEFNKDLKLHFHYSPIKVKRDLHHHGQLVLDVEHLGHLDVHAPGTKGFFKYVAREVHFNGPSEHKFEGNRTDMEM